MTPTAPQAGQRLALDQLREIAASSRGAVEIDAEPTRSDADGVLFVALSLDCARTPRAGGGVRLHRRERFVIHVPSQFPHALPDIVVPHLRWAGVPHVQWGSRLCLYAAPSVEWVPADGMYGLIERLTTWLESAAAGRLDPAEQPLHPPVAYIDAGAGVVVVRSDLRPIEPIASEPRRGGRWLDAAKHDGRPSYALAVGITEAVRDDRIDVVEWMTRGEWLRRFTAGELPSVHGDRPIAGALAVLLDRELTFEYPKRASALVSALESIGVDRADLFAAVGEVGAVNDVLRLRRPDGVSTARPEMHLFVGTPSRRRDADGYRQHLVCWRFDDVGRLIAENILFAGAADEALARVGELANQLVPGWVERADTRWVRVIEGREEVTVPRDTGTSAEWLQQRRVMVLGCGALGAPIAEACVRGQASEVHVVDPDLVTPGILVRQPYSDTDVGVPKALALAARLNAVRRDQPVRPIVGLSQATVLVGDAPPAVDLLIDATADACVSSLLELRRSQSATPWPPLVSVLIGHDARRGVASIAASDATGGGRHIVRQLMLAARGAEADRLSDVADDFFPSEPRTTTLFQPEPGCSSPTFVGSAAEVAALANHLLDVALGVLHGGVEPATVASMTAAVVRLARPAAERIVPAVDWLTWANDETCVDEALGYQVRISGPALSQMRAEVRRGSRVRAPDVETGGLLLGQVDDACRCIWIDAASGPPPDSRLSRVHFDHGVEGVDELITYHRKRSGRATSFVGMWHSHPEGAARPSPTDEAGMATLVTPVQGGPRRAVILILGGAPDRWAAWVERGEPPAIYARLVSRSGGTGVRSQPPPVPEAHYVDAWSGGWRTRQVARGPIRPVAAARPKWTPWRRRQA